MQDCQVLIVGGGPVGLTLAIDLGQRGIDVLLVEKRELASNLPKMERTHARSMEIFRRLGLADRVREVGYSLDDPYDAFLVTTLGDPPVAQLPRPSVNTLVQRSHDRNDGSFPAEPYQIVSQYALEPLLREVAESIPNVRVVFNCELASFSEGQDDVSAVLRHSDGREEKVKTTYMVGTDGASSTVRQGLGIALKGEPKVHELVQAMFRCEDLFDRIPKGAHYYRVDDRWSFIITQGDCKNFTLHAEADDVEEMPKLFEAMIGFPIKYETLYLGKWTMRLMLAERYASKRVFLAGDSVHLVTPVGGLGMNTGIGDAADLAWKLAAVLKGWGGKHLLESYEVERRAIGARNVKASERAYLARRVWRDLCSDALVQLNDDPTSVAARDELAKVWMEQHHKGSQNLGGITMGYRYVTSPVICPEAGDTGEDQARFDYVPTTLPGARIPHVWMENGKALQDEIRTDFTLICRDDPPAGVQALAQAFTGRGASFSTLTLGPAARQVAAYDRNFILVRPDLHVVWRGNELPTDLSAVVRRVCGDEVPGHLEPVPFEITLEQA